MCNIYTHLIRAVIKWQTVQTHQAAVSHYANEAAHAALRKTLANPFRFLATYFCFSMTYTIKHLGLRRFSHQVSKQDYFIPSGGKCSLHTGSKNAWLISGLLLPLLGRDERCRSSDCLRNSTMTRADREAQGCDTIEFSLTDH